MATIEIVTGINSGETYELTPGTFARVGPAERRKIVPGPDGVTVLALGGMPGGFESRAS